MNCPKCQTQLSYTYCRPVNKKGVTTIPFLYCPKCIAMFETFLKQMNTDGADSMVKMKPLPSRDAMK